MKIAPLSNNSTYTNMNQLPALKPLLCVNGACSNRSSSSGGHNFCGRSICRQMRKAVDSQLRLWNRQQPAPGNIRNGAVQLSVLGPPCPCDFIFSSTKQQQIHGNFYRRLALQQHCSSSHQPPYINTCYIVTAISYNGALRHLVGYAPEQESPPSMRTSLLIPSQSHCQLGCRRHHPSRWYRAHLWLQRVRYSCPSNRSGALRTWRPPTHRPIATIAETIANLVAAPLSLSAPT